MPYPYFVQSNTLRQILRTLLYIGPLVLWMAISLLLATKVGNYDASLTVIYTVFAYLSPELSRPDIHTMYVMNYIARRLIYIFEYGILTLLLVRAIQFGAARLKRRSILSAIILAFLFAFADNALRIVSPGRHGGSDDLLVTAVGIVLCLLLTSGYFLVKSWERQLRPPKSLANASKAEVQEVQ